MIADLAKKLAAPFPGTWDRTYVASKVKTDPLYGAVYEELRTSDLPLLDLGCGLRERRAELQQLRTTVLRPPLPELGSTLQQLRAMRDGS